MFDFSGRGDWGGEDGRAGEMVETKRNHGNCGPPQHLEGRGAAR